MGNWRIGGWKMEIVEDAVIHDEQWASEVLRIRHVYLVDGMEKLLDGFEWMGRWSTSTEVGDGTEAEMGEHDRALA